MGTDNQCLNLKESITELESLGISTPKLNELNDVHEIGNLVQKIKQMYFQKYKSTSVFTD
jgi:hypothetical protein